MPFVLLHPFLLLLLLPFSPVPSGFWIFGIAQARSVNTIHVWLNRNVIGDGTDAGDKPKRCFVLLRPPTPLLVAGYWDCCYCCAAAAAAATATATASGDSSDGGSGGGSGGSSGGGSGGGWC